MDVSGAVFGMTDQSQKIFHAFEVSFRRMPISQIIAMHRHVRQAVKIIDGAAIAFKDTSRRNNHGSKVSTKRC